MNIIDFGLTNVCMLIFAPFDAHRTRLVVQRRNDVDNVQVYISVANVCMSFNTPDITTIYVPHRVTSNIHSEMESTKTASPTFCNVHFLVLVVLELHEVLAFHKLCIQCV